MSQTAQFSHANGFPAATYKVLFDQLPEIEFHAIPQLGSTPEALNRDFQNLADEIITDIESKNPTKPVIGMGHSLGGVVTLLAAGRRPDLISEVILFDPPFFSDWKRFVIRMGHRLGFGDRLGPVKKSKVRRDRFENLEEAEAYFRKKPFFQRFHSQAFQDYLKHGLREHPEGGVTLSISREMESEVFRTIHPGRPPGLENVKGTVVYGEQSDLIWRSDMKWWYKNLSHLDIIAFPGGHLFPLEQPEATAKLIREILNRRKQ